MSSQVLGSSDTVSVREPWTAFLPESLSVLTEPEGEVLEHLEKDVKYSMARWNIPSLLLGVSCLSGSIHPISVSREVPSTREVKPVLLEKKNMLLLPRGCNCDSIASFLDQPSSASPPQLCFRPLSLVVMDRAGFPC